MEYILTLIANNISYTPIIVFAVLAISGFGAAISEDALVIASGVLASQYPHITIPLYIAIVLGAFGAIMLRIG